MHKLTRKQSARYNNLLEEKCRLVQLLQYSQNRCRELQQRKAPAWMIERYTQDIEIFMQRLEHMESEIGDLIDLQYKR